jgi:hypothetical protein
MRFLAAGVPATLCVVALAAWVRPTPTPTPIPTPVGPPWLSLELPANALDRETRGAALTVRVYHHAQAVTGSMRGRAEGLVDGQRRSIPLEFIPTSHTGVYAIPQNWPDQGTWLLTINGSQDATLLVELGPHGGFEKADYYGQPTQVASVRSIRIVEGELGKGDVDRLLDRHAAVGQ